MKKTLITLVALLAFFVSRAQDVPQSKPVVRSVIYVPQASAPSSPSIGEKYLNVDGSYYRWNGSAWIVDVVGGSPTTDASQLTTGVLANARVQQSNVTQHQSAISINESQISDLAHTVDTKLSDPEVEAAYNTQVPVASQAEAETGTATTVRRWTAQRIAQAIAAQAGDATVTELTQSEFNALDTAEKKALGLYVIVPPAPSGYTVTIDEDPVLANGLDSFTWAGAEVGSFYDYSFTSSGGGTPVTGFGEIATATDQITDIDLSGLTDGTITLTAYLWNAGGDGANATDTADKSTAVADLFLDGNAASAGVDEANATTGWVSSGGPAPITSIANTDPGGGGSYMINCGCDSAGFRSGTVSIPGHTIGLTYTSTIRSRRTDGTGRIFNWVGVTGAAYDIDFDAVSNGDWIVGTVTYEATATTVDLRVYACDNDGTTTGTIQVSEIVIVQNP